MINTQRWKGERERVKEREKENVCDCGQVCIGERGGKREKERERRGEKEGERDGEKERVHF